MRRDKLLIARAIIAEKDGKISTATWGLKHHVWFCASASKGLKWMKGMENFETVKRRLKSEGFSWRWIVPEFNPKPIKPPFMP